ncbi:hypothetical protein MHYP_G00359050 [Metynnis hypsauchen]
MAMKSELRRGERGQKSKSPKVEGWREDETMCCISAKQPKSCVTLGCRGNLWLSAPLAVTPTQCFAELLFIDPIADHPSFFLRLSGPVCILIASKFVGATNAYLSKRHTNHWELARFLIGCQAVAMGGQTALLLVSSQLGP